MKKFRLLLPMVAIVLALFASAFTMKDNATSDLVWFKVNPSNGQLVDATNGYQGDEPPVIMDCNDFTNLCSIAFSINQNEVELVGSSYHLKQGVDIENDRNDERYED